MAVASQRVAIVGAGITGLLTAQGLQKNGLDVVVYERDSALDVRPRDWTILVHWAMPIFTKLLPPEVLHNLPSAICNPALDFDEDVETLPCYNGLTGEILFNSPTPGARRVTRQKLRRVLVDGLEIQWGKSLAQISSTDEALNLAFEDGSEATAGYLIGADGAASKVRELLLGPETAKPVPCGFMFATGICKYGDAEKVDAVIKSHPVAAIMMGSEAVGGIGVMSADTPEDISTWTTFWVKIWKGEPVNLHGPEALAYMKANTQNLCEPFKSAIDWTPEGSTCDIDEMKYWVASPWDNRQGRVTLLGDAAHPMLPFRGQGLQHAMTDASNYVDTLVDLDHDANPAERQKRMTDFDTELLERGNKAVKQSLQEAEYSLDVNTVSKMLMVKQGHGRSA